MTDTVRDFKNRRSAVDLLRQLGIAPYHYDDLIQEVGDRYHVTLRDGKPVSKIVLLGEALHAGAPLPRPAETPAVAAQRTKQVTKLGQRYGRTEAEARAAEAPKPKKAKKPKKARRPKAKPKKRVRRLRGERQPRPACLNEAQVATAVKTLRATAIAPACLELYLAGRSTAEVWLIVQARFKLGEDKRSYPSWYLCHYRRRGLLPASKEA